MVYTGPTYVGKSTAITTAASGTIDFTSSGRVAGSLLHIVAETANQAITAPSGFVERTPISPQSRGTAGAAGGVRLTLFEKISDGTETTVTIPAVADHKYAIGFVYPPGTVVEADAGNNEALSGTGTFGGVTTAGQALIATYVATDNDQTGASWSAQTNANLASITERHDLGSADGQGGGIMLVTGTREASGATGNTTATQTNTRAYCWITLALIYAPSGTTVAPTGGSILYTGHVPTIVRTGGQAIAPIGGSMLFTGHVPVVTRTAHRVIAPSGGSIFISGNVPVVARTANVVVRPGAGHMRWRGYRPTIGTPVVTTSRIRRGLRLRRLGRLGF